MNGPKILSGDEFGRLIRGERDEPHSCPLHGEDAIHALRIGFEQFIAKHEFAPGMLVMQKDGLASNSHAADRQSGRPGIFIRWLDPNAERALPAFKAPDVGQPYDLTVMDCLVGWLSPDGGMVVSFVCSEVFEPYVAPEA